MFKYSPSQIRKFLVASFGLAVILATRFVGADSDLVFVIEAVGTAYGVYRVPNEQ